MMSVDLSTLDNFWLKRLKQYREICVVNGIYLGRRGVHSECEPIQIINTLPLDEMFGTPGLQRSPHLLNALQYCKEAECELFKSRYMTKKDSIEIFKTSTNGQYMVLKNNDVWDTLENYLKNKNKRAESPYRLLNVPADGNCFYHCLVKAMKYMPVLKDIYIKHSVDLSSIEDPMMVFRMIFARNITDDDFENYKLLCIVEPENTQCESIADFRWLVCNTNEYANSIIISILHRLGDGNLSISIYNSANIQSSPNEWNHDCKSESDIRENAPYGPMWSSTTHLCLLLANNHYNIITKN